MTIEYILNPRVWVEFEGYLAEPKGSNSSCLYSRIEKITNTLYIGVRKEEHLNNSSPQYNL